MGILRSAFLTPLHSLTLLDVSVFAAALLGLFTVIDILAWVWRVLTDGAEDEQEI